MFMDITQFIDAPDFFPTIMIQPNAKNYLIGMNCDGEYLFKGVSQEVYNDQDALKSFIESMYYTLEGKLKKNTLQGKKECAS